jgi:hypothetical protein
MGVQFSLCLFVFAEIAQRLERGIENPEVVRSNRIFGMSLAPVMKLVDVIELGSMGF